MALEVFRMCDVGVRERIEPVAVPKTEEARAFIFEVVKESALFAGANPAQREQLVDAMQEIEASEGQMIIKQGENVKGHGLALLTSSALVGGMAPRALKTGKLMPAGLLAILGAGSAAYHAKKTLEWWDSE